MKGSLSLSDSYSSQRGSYSGSDDDDSSHLSSTVAERYVHAATRAQKTVANRLKYFKMHSKLLKMEGGKVVDPYGHTFQAVAEKMDFKPKGLSRVDSSVSRESRFVPQAQRSQSKVVDAALRPSMSSDDYQHTLEKISKTKNTEDMERKMKQYHNMRMKKLLTIDNLIDYLGTLEKQQQQRLIEEHRTEFRKFKYGGPAREGPLFCLREKFRRSRKQWRVKYAKMYGVLCRRVRLEKRLMRKASRLITRERILNALKDKTKNKILVLLEMKHEFKKLVEKLRLNKEIQEKIKRQENLRKHLTKSVRTRAVKSPVSNAKTNMKVPKMEAGETQRAAANVNLKAREKPLDSSIRKQLKALPPLPKPPLAPELTARSKVIEPGVNKFPEPEAACSNAARFPTSTTDKKLGSPSTKDLGIPASKSRSSRASKVPKAKIADNCRRELPLVQDLKYGALPVTILCDNRMKAASRELDFDKYKDSEVRSKIPKTQLTPDDSKCQFLPRRVLPGQYVRKFEVDSIPRLKYKPEKEAEVVLEPFASHCRQVLNDELKVGVEDQGPGFLDTFTRDLVIMGDFILDHLHLLPPQDLELIVKNLVNLKEERLSKGSVSCIAKPLFPGDWLTLREALKLSNDSWKVLLEEHYADYLEQQKLLRNRHWFVKQGQRKLSSMAPEEKKRHSKKTVKTLADRLLLRRTKSFKNPVRVTTNLGGKLMLQGWKYLPFEQYFNLGVKLSVSKSGWRKDDMGDYEVIAPSPIRPEIKYYLVMNRLDLTPRRFQFPGYFFNPNFFKMMKHCSTFYRNHMLKRSDIKAEGDKSKRMERVSRNYVTTTLPPGAFRIPHLRHRIFSSSGSGNAELKTRSKAPLIFSRRQELPGYDQDDPKSFRIVLQETETVHLWSFESKVAEAGTDEAVQYLKDKRRARKYKNRFHRTFERGTQTDTVNFIERFTQLHAPLRDSKKTSAQETEISDAYKEPPLPVPKTLKKPGFQIDESSDSSTELSESSAESYQNDTTKILTSSEFVQKAKLTLRILDSQWYSQKQLIFRQGRLLDPLDPKSQIAYSHEKLFSFIDKRIALSEFVVTSMCWSVTNPNLLAVGYARHPLYPEQDKGMICIWNIKMITKYEKKFDFKSSVTHLEFCALYPRLLNVALMDGSVVILDLAAKKNVIFMNHSCSVFSEYKPVWQFSWMELEKDYFVPLTCGDSGVIHQLRPDGTFQPTKFLCLGHREGNIKGIRISSSMGLKPRIKGRPGITCIEKHPSSPVLYLVGTTDGCVHICSVHFRNQHLDVFLAHTGTVKGIKFHPHCEHVFMTYGEDFYIRIWLYGTFEPALELMTGYFYVRSAVWSPVNPEILVCVSGKLVAVWDIRRKSDSPIHKFRTPRELENTTVIFDKSGHNILVGNIGGDVHVYALKDLPFTPHFKGEAIANALEKVLKAKKKFAKDIKKLGYPFGAIKDQLGSE